MRVPRATTSATAVTTRASTSCGSCAPLPGAPDRRLFARDRLDGGDRKGPADRHPGADEDPLGGATSRSRPAISATRKPPATTATATAMTPPPSAVICAGATYRPSRTIPTRAVIAARCGRGGQMPALPTTIPRTIANSSALTRRDARAHADGQHSSRQRQAESRCHPGEPARPGGVLRATEASV